MTEEVEPRCSHWPGQTSCYWCALGLAEALVCGFCGHPPELHGARSGICRGGGIEPCNCVMFPEHVELVAPTPEPAP